MASDASHGASMRPRGITLDGNRVAYRLAGGGPLLLLVHGLAGSSATWSRVMPALARRFTVLAPDLLGQGESDKPSGDDSLGAHANTLRDLLDALGDGRATVVGQSLGGGVAMQFAYQFPERCERLVLVDRGGLRDVIDHRGQAVSAIARLYRAARIPTLIVWGAQDPFIRVSHATAAHEAIPGSRVEIFQGVGVSPRNRKGRWWTRTQSIRTAGGPAIRGGAARDRGTPGLPADRSESPQLRELGMSDRMIAGRLGATDETIAKAIAWVQKAE